MKEEVIQVFFKTIIAYFEQGKIKQYTKLIQCLEVSTINSLFYSKRTLIYYAIEKAQIEAVKLLIEKGADVNIKSIFGYTPLHYLLVLYKEKNAKFKSVFLPICKILLAHGADLSQKDDEGFSSASVISIADFVLEKERTAIFDYVHILAKEKGAKENIFIDNVVVLLEVLLTLPLAMTSIIRKYIELFLNLTGSRLQEQQKINFLSKAILYNNDWGYLEQFFQEKHWPTLKFSIELDNGRVIKKVEVYLIYLCILKKQRDYLARLLKHGANPDVCYGAVNISPLMIATQENNIEACKLLLLYGANPNAYSKIGLLDENGDNYAPIHIAARLGYLDIFNLFLKNKANIYLKTKDGFSDSMILAMEFKQYDIIKTCFQSIFPQLKDNFNPDGLLFYIYFIQGERNILYWLDFFIKKASDKLKLQQELEMCIEFAVTIEDTEARSLFLSAFEQLNYKNETVIKHQPTVIYAANQTEALLAQSSRAYLREFGLTDEEINRREQELKARKKKIQNTKYIPEQAIFSQEKNVPESWFDHLVSVEDAQVKKIENNKINYLWLPKNQFPREIFNKFDSVRPIIDEHHLKIISAIKSAIKVILFDKIYVLEFAGELKISSSKERLMVFKINNLFVPLIYLEDGLHDDKSVSQIKQLCANTIIDLTKEFPVISTLKPSGA